MQLLFQHCNKLIVDLSVWAFFNTGNVNLKTDAISIQIDYSPSIVTPTSTSTPITDFKQMDGRYYTVTASTQDKVGNASQKLENIIVLHDQRK